MRALGAAAAIKWILQDESHSAAALTYREQHIPGTNRIAIPELLYYEVANILATKILLTTEEAIEGFHFILGSELEGYRLGLRSSQKRFAWQNDIKLVFTTAAILRWPPPLNRNSSLPMPIWCLRPKVFCM